MAELFAGIFLGWLASRLWRTDKPAKGKQKYRYYFRKVRGRYKYYRRRIG